MHRTVVRRAARTLSTAANQSTPPGPNANKNTVPPKKRASPQRRRAVDIGLIGASVAALSGLFIWQRSLSSSSSSQLTATSPTSAASSNPSSGQTFTLQIPSSSAYGQGTKTLNMLSQSQAEAKIREHEASWTISRPGRNIVTRWDTSVLASNSPLEDDHAVSVITRDPTSEVQGDLLMFAVMDGHSGWQTSKHLSEHLIPYVSRELHGVFSASPEYEALRVSALQELTSTGTSAKAKLSALSQLIKGGNLRRSSEGDVRFANLDEDPNVVAQALRNAFVKLDKDISDRPLNLLKQAQSSSTTSPAIPSPDDLQSVLPALSGSCALLSVIDTARNRLSVAVTGDSRAVMGVWEPPSKGFEQGRWKVDVLTDDQTGRNLKEVARMQREHPAGEKDTVVQRGRVLGHLEPTRAFGDNRYKWPVGVYQQVAKYFNLSFRGDPRGYSSPPYVTADPVVTDRTLDPIVPSKSNASRTATEKPKRFLIMATDGLFDQLENDTIVGLVGAHLDGQRSVVDEKDLLKRVVPDPKDVAASGHVPAQKRQGKFLFVDGNLSTHLIRNALGGADTEHFRGLLSIPPPLSRRYRDDISVIVVLMDDGKEKDPRTLMGISHYSPDAHFNKAKL